MPEYQNLTLRLVESKKMSQNMSFVNINNLKTRKLIKDGINLQFNSFEPVMISECVLNKAWDFFSETAC